MVTRGKYDFDFGGKQVLVVEDNLISFKLISAVLTKVNAGIIHANNGRKAIELCKAGTHFDLVLMDMQMPEVGGLEATREIKRCCPGLPVIATTANTYDEDEAACRDAGCDAFITKPLKFERLFELMESFFDHKE